MVESIVEDSEVSVTESVLVKWKLEVLVAADELVGLGIFYCKRKEFKIIIKLEQPDNAGETNQLTKLTQKVELEFERWRIFEGQYFLVEYFD